MVDLFQFTLSPGSCRPRAPYSSPSWWPLFPKVQTWKCRHAGRNQAVDAPRLNSSLSISRGVAPPRICRGVSLSSFCTHATCSGVTVAKSVPFCRTGPSSFCGAHCCLDSRNAVQWVYTVKNLFTLFSRGKSCLLTMHSNSHNRY